MDISGRFFAVFLPSFCTKIVLNQALTKCSVTLKVRSSPLSLYPSVNLFPKWPRPGMACGKWQENCSPWWKPSG